MNAVKVLDLCLNTHKSIAFSRIDGVYHATTAGVGRTAPDLETLIRDLGWDTADSAEHRSKQLGVQADEQRTNARAIYDELCEDKLPESPRLPTIPAPPDLFESDSPPDLRPILDEGTP